MSLRLHVRRLARATRALSPRPVPVTYDHDATRAIREQWKDAPAGDGPLVAWFDADLSLYRILDGEELKRIVRTGKILGGMFSIKAERRHGASWGENVSEVISWGNNARGHRLGDELFLAKIDARGKKFFHMNPHAPYDPSSRAGTMDAEKCNTGLGCSVSDVSRHEARFYRVDRSGRMEPMTDAEVTAYAAGKPKNVELRQVSGVMFHGTIHGVDVRVVKEQDDTAYKGTWEVTDRDEEPIVLGAKSDKVAVARAEKLLKYGRRHVPPLDLLPKIAREAWRKRMQAKERGGMFGFRMSSATNGK